MKNTIIACLKKSLPNSLVEAIRTWRKARRQDKRFKINNGEDVVTQVEILGSTFSIYINPFLNGGVDEVIHDTGHWEPELSELIKKYLPIGGTFVDIGANIGYHSLFAATIVGQTGRAVSFEPIPRLQEQLRKSIAANNLKNVVIEPVALGDTFSTATLSLVEENIGASSIKNVANDRAVGGSVVVPVTTLDSYSEKIGKIDVIKIDIEGAECEALLGAKEILRRHQPVIILEFSPQIYENDRSGKTLDFYLYLKNLGYSLQVIDSPEIDLEERIKTKQFAELHTNLICLPVT